MRGETLLQMFSVFIQMKSELLICPQIWIKTGECFCGFTFEVPAEQVSPQRGICCGDVELSVDCRQPDNGVDIQQP